MLFDPYTYDLVTLPRSSALPRRRWPPTRCWKCPRKRGRSSGGA